MAGKLATQKAAETFDTVVDFLESFETLEDPRQRAKVLDPLDEVLLLVLLGVITGCESWVEIARYGERKLPLLRRFRPFKDGTPSHDPLGDIFAVLDAERFQACFVAWVAGLTGLGPEIVAIDGKTPQRSYQEGGAKVIEKQADYVPALKGNQGTLRDDVEEFFAEQKANKFSDSKPSRHETLEKSHGRIETRTVTAVGAIDWLTERHGWEGLASIVMVESCREIGARTECESRFYITSLSADAERLSTAIRDHRGVENGLHWVMHMVFRDDECRIRTGNAPANVTTVKHMASNLPRQAPGKDSLRVERKVAAWDRDHLAGIVAPR